MEDIHEATSILFKVFREKHNSGRFLTQIKAKFLRNYRQPCITYGPTEAALKCKSRRCWGCLYFEEKSHFSNDDSDFPILGGWIKLLFENIIYIIECRACGGKYFGETWRCLKHRMFNHTSDINWNKDGPVSRYLIMLTILVWDRENMFLYPI